MANEVSESPLMTEKEFGQAVGLAAVTIRKRRERGELSFYRFGRAIRYSLAMVEEFKRKNMHNATED